MTIVPMTNSNVYLPLYLLSLPIHSITFSDGSVCLPAGQLFSNNHRPTCSSKSLEVSLHLHVECPGHTISLDGVRTLDTETPLVQMLGQEIHTHQCRETYTQLRWGPLCWSNNLMACLLSVASCSNSQS